MHGRLPGDPYLLLKALAHELHFKRPLLRVLANIVRSIGIEHLVPIAPPPQESLPRWLCVAEGLRHSKSRDAEAIHHHYDEVERLRPVGAGPSMTYTCAVYPHPEATLELAQENKYRLVFDKLRLSAGDTLLDVGCGWGGMVRYAARQGVRAIGATLWRSRPDGPSARSPTRNCPTAGPGAGHRDYRDVDESGFDAVSSIGMTEHIGVANYPAYFGFLKSSSASRGLLLESLHHPADNKSNVTAGYFIDRYVFPTALAGLAASSARSRTPAWKCCTTRTCATTTS